MTTTSPPLPIELVADIIQHVERHDLAAVATGNKALHALSLPYLYNRVRFSRNSTLAQVLQLLSNLQASETVARLVRELALDWHVQDVSQWASEESKVTRAMANVLPAMTNLASLSLPRLLYPNAVLKILEAVSCPPVRALHIYSPSLFVAPPFPFSLLQPLERLSLWAEDISWQWQPDSNDTKSLSADEGSLAWLSVTCPFTLGALMYIVPMGSLRTLVIHPSTIDVTSNERYFRLIRRLPPLRSVFLLDWLSCQLLAQSSIDPFPDVLTLGIPLCQLEEQFSSSTYGNMHDTMQVLAAIFPHMHTLDVRCPEAYEGSTHAHLQPDEALRRFQMHLLAAAPRTLRRFAYVTEASFARASEDEPFVRVSQLADEIQ